MSIGSSPGTSDMSSVTTRAGWQAAASRPPLIADRCRRTQFISLIVAPDFEQRAIDVLLVVEREARRRQREQRRAAAGDQRDHEIVGREPANQVEHPLRGGEPGRVGTGCAASTISMRSHGTA